MVWVSCRVIAEGGSLSLSTVALDLDRITGTHVKRDLTKRTQRRVGIQALEQGTLVSTTPNIMYKAANCQSKVESEIAPIMATSSSGVLQHWLRPPLRKSSGVRNSQGIIQISRPSGKLHRPVSGESERKDSGCSSWSNSENTFGIRRFVTRGGWKMGLRLKEAHQKFPTLATTSASCRMKYGPTRRYAIPEMRICSISNSTMVHKITRVMSWEVGPTNPTRFLHCHESFSTSRKAPAHPSKHPPTNPLQ